MSKETDSMITPTIHRAAGRVSALRRLALIACLTAATLVWLAPQTASALTIHAFSASFASPGSGAGQVSLVSASGSSAGSEVAVNSTTGDVYVADTGNRRVDEFAADGTFVRAWGWGVADGASQFETCTTSCQAGVAGSGPGQFTTPSVIAVDNSTGPSSGDVYVGDNGDDMVTKFTADGAIVSTWGDATPADGQLSGKNTTNGSFSGLAGLGVDGAGSLWVYESPQMVEYGQDGSLATQWSSGYFSEPPSGLGIDSAGDLYVNGVGGIDKLSPTGTNLSFVEYGAYTVTGLAVDPVANDLYAGDGSEIHHYTSACDPTQGFCTENDAFGSGHLSGSAAGVGVNSASGTVYVADAGAGAIVAFGAETLPDVATASPSNVTQTGATLNGTVNPDGVQVTDCHFEYGTDTSYGQSVPCTQTPAQIGAGNSPVAVSANISNLQVAGGYHFRLDAGNANGESRSFDAVFPTVGPGFGVKSFSFDVTDQHGNPYAQAGGHPYALTADVHFNTQLDQQLNLEPDENVKDLRVDLPPGLLANPTAVPRCSQSDFLNQSGWPQATNCPADTQIGVVTFDYANNGGVATAPGYPVYNLVAPDGEPAQFGFQLLQNAEYVHGAVRTGGDYGLSSSTVVTEAVPVISATLTLWGDPADPSHDPDRSCPGYAPASITGVSCTSSAPQTPLLTMPTSCPGTPLSASVQADSWENPGSFVSASSSSPATTGCGSLQFNPSISVQPDTSQADSPSGLSVDLHNPQDGLTDPAGLAPADLKTADVTLPQGMSVDPSAANGLQACTPAQIGIDNANEPSCPDGSKVGSVQVDSPLLPDPLTGEIYIAQQDQNPFNSLLAIYVTAEADGALIKLAGHVVADPVTGQLETVFDNNPQLPFTDFKLTFWGGPRGVLATPESCGTYSTSSDLTPWSGGAVSSSSDSFAISSGCVSGFSPSFTAGTENPQAGAYSPMVMSFSRPDTSQDLQGLTVKLPPGLVAKLAGVSLCTGSELAAAASKTGAQEQGNPSCPANSLVGTVKTGAGPGPDSEFLPGKAYLTGPYKGAPYGLAEVVPVVAGPYDLGTVVVRQALHIDPTTAQVTAISDNFPTILQGIPLRLRRVDVDLNRPDFIINPTSCDPMSVTGTLSSTLAISAPVSSRFQVGGCASLPFSPKLKMRLTGKGQTKSGKHPNLISTLTQKPGQANIRNVRVALPLNFALDPNNSQVVCPYSIASAVTTGPANCPADTKVGTATAVTPLLSQPLTGPVYLVQGIRYENGTPIHTLPSLLIPLRGQIALDLRAQTSVSHGKLVTTFPTVPDAAVSKFSLTISGGRKGILVITGRGRSICGKPQVTQATLGAQSGKAEYPSIKMSTPCRSSHHKTRHHHKHK